MNSYNLNIIQDKLNNLHPMQVINKVGNINISMYKVKYEYRTTRGNKKQGEKYFLLNTLNPDAELKNDFIKWVEDYNKSNEHRRISNVKFLESRSLGFLSI